VVYNTDGWALVYDNCRHDGAEVSVPSSETRVIQYLILDGGSRVVYNMDRWTEVSVALQDTKF
jgi:hypothetical protein